MSEEKTKTVILPWPNTKANVEKQIEELRSQGFTAKSEKHGDRTYVVTNWSAKNDL